MFYSVNSFIKDPHNEFPLLPSTTHCSIAVSNVLCLTSALYCRPEAVNSAPGEKYAPIYEQMGKCKLCTALWVGNIGNAAVMAICGKVLGNYI